MQRIDIDDPDVDMDDSERLHFRGEPFTGEVTEYRGGSLVSLENYADGLVHGLSWEWYKDGALRSEGTARRGRAIGVWREWHPDGRLASEKEFGDDGAMLSHREWGERGGSTSPE